MIAWFASEPQYLAHLLPIYRAMATGERGFVHLGGRLPARRLPGVLSTDLRMGRPAGRGLVVVASYRDLRAMGGRPCVLVEHGAGQSYGDGHPSYSGGRERGSVVLFVVPNETVAARNRAVYPGTPIAVVGCPKLDRWYSPQNAPERRQSTNSGASPVVCVSFHWDWQNGPPEGRSAFPHYDHALAKLRDGPWHLIGHSHPRAWRAMKRVYDRLGIEPVEDFEEVMERADLYACDNSSTLFEFAATGRPVVVLNAPWYRRDVEHGLRFWEHADVGLQVDEPEHLLPTVERALTDPPEARYARERVVMQTYPLLDGRASERAAQALRAAAEEQRDRRRATATPARPVGA